jgi:hypothetical protein
MSFDISRLRRADQIVGGGAILFFIFLFFFKWFGGSVSGALPAGSVSTGSSSTGWDTFTNSRWIWLITIIVALGSVVLVAGQRTIKSPIQPSVIVAGLGALSTIFILYRIIHHPSASASFGGIHASYGIKIGIWLGLIAALAITYGGYLQMQAEGTSLSDVREQASSAFSGVAAPTRAPSSGGGSSAGSEGSAPTATPPPPSTPPAAPPAPAPPPPSPPAAPPTPPSAAPPIPPPATPPGAESSGETPPASYDA